MVSSKLLSLVMEFADDGDLFQKISEHQRNGTYFTEGTIWKIFIQMVKGLKALHELKIMHRDLKSANVFLFKDGSAKLGDLNVSKVAKKGLLYTQTGTPYYASPEVWRDQPYDIKSDIWSLGCVTYQMITLKPPFRAQDMPGLYKKVLKGHYPKIPTIYSNDLNNIIKAMLQVSAHMRPICERILQMPSVIRRMESCFPTQSLFEDEDEENILMKTIRVPKNLMYLTERLPKSCYEDDQMARVTGKRSSRLKTSDISHVSLPNINMARQVYSGLSPPVSLASKYKRKNKMAYHSNLVSRKSRQVLPGISQQSSVNPKNNYVKEAAGASREPNKRNLILEDDQDSSIEIQRGKGTSSSTAVRKQTGNSEQKSRQSGKRGQHTVEDKPASIIKEESQSTLIDSVPPPLAKEIKLNEGISQANKESQPEVKVPDSLLPSSSKKHKIKRTEDSKLIITDLKSLPPGLQPAQVLGGEQEEVNAASSILKAEGLRGAGSSVAAEGGSRVSRIPPNSHLPHYMMPTKRPKGYYSEDSPGEYKYARGAPYKEDAELRKYYHPPRNKIASIYTSNNGASSLAHLSSIPHPGAMPAPSYLSSSPSGKKKLQRDYSKEKLDSVNNYLYQLGINNPAYGKRPLNQYVSEPSQKYKDAITGIKLPKLSKPPLGGQGSQKRLQSLDHQSISLAGHEPSYQKYQPYLAGQKLQRQAANLGASKQGSYAKGSHSHGKPSAVLSVGSTRQEVIEARLQLLEKIKKENPNIDRKPSGIGQSLSGRRLYGKHNSGGIGSPSRQLKLLTSPSNGIDDSPRAKE